MKNRLIFKEGISRPVNIYLPGSKSQSNRALILAHQCNLNFNQISGLSESRDTQLLLSNLVKLDSLRNQLQKKGPFLDWAHYQLSENEIDQLTVQSSNELQEFEFDFMDAGTPARFILAYFSALGILTKLNGNDSLQNRTMQPLIDVLESGGAKFEYTKKAGHFPISITKGLWSFPKTPINRTQSSQFVSALMLIAPIYPGDKEIQLLGEIHSDGYIEMTQKVLKDFGIHVNYDKNTQIIHISEGKPKVSTIDIEGDWSSASYFYAICALGKVKQICFPQLKNDSCQGDIKGIHFFEQLGVATEFNEHGCCIQLSGKVVQEINWDLSEVPDLAPTLIITAAALGLNAEIKGIENLKFKECNRIDVMNENLEQFGYSLMQSSNHSDIYFLQKSQIPVITNTNKFIKTHSDHRMAMAFAPMATFYNVEFDDLNCIEKSFPNFWNELQKCNFEII